MSAPGEAAVDEVAARLVDLVVARTGARPDALRAGALRRVAGALSPADLERPGALDAAADAAVGEAVVGETYLFRHPEQLRFGAAEALVAWRGSGRERLRAWSAGCATGEEGWSLAAILAAAVGPERCEVLGTDLVPAHVEAARRGMYGPWSRRDVGPLEWTALEGGGPASCPVDRRLRESARFAVHNLFLDPAPAEGQFDLVSCRNVIVYMTPAAATRALACLAAAVVPGGLLLLGPADLPPGVGVPAGFVPLGPADLLCWTRRAPAASRPSSASSAPVATRRPASAAPAPATLARPSSRAPAAPAAPAAHVAAHAAALAAIERGDVEGAARGLSLALERAPLYARGHLELALLLARLGRVGAASAAASVALARVETVADHEPVEGPGACSAGHVRRSAQALLQRLRGATA